MSKKIIILPPETASAVELDNGPAWASFSKRLSEKTGNESRGSRKAKNKSTCWSKMAMLSVMKGPAQKPSRLCEIVIIQGLKRHLHVYFTIYLSFLNVLNVALPFISLDGIWHTRSALVAGACLTTRCGAWSIIPLWLRLVTTAASIFTHASQGTVKKNRIGSDRFTKFTYSETTLHHVWSVWSRFLQFSKQICEKKHRVRWTLEGSTSLSKYIDVFSNNQCSPTVRRSWCLQNLKQMWQIPKTSAAWSVLICMICLQCFFWPVCYVLTVALLWQCRLVCSAHFVSPLVSLSCNGDCMTWPLSHLDLQDLRLLDYDGGKHAEFQQHKLTEISTSFHF